MGTALTERLITTQAGFLERVKYDTVWTSQSQYTRLRSRYTTKITTRVVETRPCRFFGNAGDSGAVRRDYSPGGGHHPCC